MASNTDHYREAVLRLVGDHHKSEFHRRRSWGSRRRAALEGENKLRRRAAVAQAGLLVLILFAASSSGTVGALKRSSAPTQTGPVGRGGANTGGSSGERDAPSLVPNALIENAGQVRNGNVRFYFSSGGLRAGFTDSAILLTLVQSKQQSSNHRPPVKEIFQPELPAVSHAVLLRMKFEGANDATPEGREELPYRSNYFIGNDPTKWHTGVRGYGAVLYEDLFDGIDLVYRGANTGLKYEFFVHPGADPAQIQMRYEGAQRLDFDSNGDLILQTPLGPLRDMAPSAHQGWHAIPCSYVERASAVVGVRCSPWDRSRPLIIDPLLYSTFIGAGDWDAWSAIAVDSSGSAYLTGPTRSPDFPTTPGTFDTSYSGNDDVFVAKLDASGANLLYSTFLGGGDSDLGSSIAVDSSGNAYVAGTTNSTDFPTTVAAFDRTLNGKHDAFVTKLSPSGSTLVYSTYVGGGDEEGSPRIALDAAGGAHVTGSTRSVDFPTTTMAFQANFGGGVCGGGPFPSEACMDSFVTEVNEKGSALVYSTYLGGSGHDFGNGIGIDSEGKVFVAGGTTSPDFPTTPGAFDTTCGADGSCDTGSPFVGGMWDAYVTKLSATGSALLYSTYVGGTRHNVSTPFGVAITGSDLALGIAIDPAGDAYVTGMTDSIDFPVTATAFQKAPGGGTDGFVTKLNPTGKALLFSTYLGGSDSDQPGLGEGIALDSIGDAYIAGITLSSDFPTTSGAFDTSFNGGGADAFVTKVDASGGALLNSTFLGGIKWEAATSIALDSPGDAFVTGLTDSADFPTTPGAFSTSFSGYGSVYVTEIKFGAVGPAPLNVPVIAYVTGGAAVAVAVVALLWIRRYRTRSPPPPPASP